MEVVNLKAGGLAQRCYGLGMKRLFVGVLWCALLLGAAPTLPAAAPADPLAAAQRAMDARTGTLPGTGIILGYIDPGGVKIPAR